MRALIDRIRLPTWPHISLVFAAPSVLSSGEWISIYFNGQGRKHETVHDSVAFLDWKDMPTEGYQQKNKVLRAPVSQVANHWIASMLFRMISRPPCKRT